jgi:DNA-binding GntR family transcriptional regulator
VSHAGAHALARRPAGAGLARTVLRDQVKDLLLARILSGEYAPGERLVETRIAQELGTSQSPVREALRELELLRFVESEPFKGARVRSVSRAELAEIYPVRAALEELAGREAARRLGGRVEAFEAELRGMLAAAGRRDLPSQVEHDVRFHRLIVEAAGNTTLLEVWTSLRVEARTVVTALAVDFDRHELAALHVPVLEGLAAADPEASATAIRRHFDHLSHLLLSGGG